MFLFPFVQTYLGRPVGYFPRPSHDNLPFRSLDRKV